MIKIENLEVLNFEGALRGMRNPLESWSKSDSYYDKETGKYVVGPKDLDLALKLTKSGSDHSKFLRQIFVSMDITAPMSWWWDFDTYKVATVRNSTSRMHKLGTRLLTEEDFSFDDEDGNIQITPFRKYVMEDLNRRIKEYQQLKADGKMEEATRMWRDIVFDSPQNYNFRSTWTGNYETMRNVYRARRNHKQREFRDFCKFIEEEFPYSELITTPREG
ncbi:MAG: FAD-dependent thymidylate synthase [Clostridia bacterium]|nr:FAD-dependent thymidylate synthase [Clostridia bacterium]